MRDYPRHGLVVGVATSITLLTARIAPAVPVAYPINMIPGTSNGQDVTDIMIFEQSATGDLNIDFPYTVSASGYSLLSHDAPFEPVSSLIFGLTEGVEKTQIVMFTNDAFAEAAAGLPFSESFSSTRHSELIEHLTLAQGGDQAELEWFTDTFWPADGVTAAFATGGPFTAVEFSSGVIVGGNIQTEGDWIIIDHDFIPRDDPNAHFGLATVDIDEMATDAGPFDIEVTVDLESMCCDSLLAIDKDVLNESGADWTEFHWQLGFGLGANFEPSSASDDLNFQFDPAPLDENGAFPDVAVESDDLRFFGSLPESATTSIWASLRVPRELADENGMVTFTIRQTADLIPEPANVALLGLGLVIGACCGRTRHQCR